MKWIKKLKKRILWYLYNKIHFDMYLKLPKVLEIEKGKRYIIEVSEDIDESHLDNLGTMLEKQIGKKFVLINTPIQLYKIEK